jgi:hypothetical protein
MVGTGEGVSGGRVSGIVETTGSGVTVVDGGETSGEGCESCPNVTWGWMPVPCGCTWTGTGTGSGTMQPAKIVARMRMNPARIVELLMDRRLAPRNCLYRFSVLEYL